MTHPIIIIGSGLAGYNVAKEFRKLDTQTPLVILTSDDGAYYSKPMLSSAFTTGKTPDTLPLGDAEKMKAQLDAEIITFIKVEKIDTANKQIITDKKPFDYSQCVLACGANIIPAPLSGSGADDVFHVNNLMDYRQFRKSVAEMKTVALLGAGLIGCEFANDLLNADKKVHCIALSRTPLDLLLPERAGEVVKIALEAKGVNWHLEERIEEVEKTDDGLSIQLSGGDTIAVDCLLSAIGIRPNVSFAETSNIEVNKGIVVDTYLQTSAKDVFALGDCAEVGGMVLQYVAPILQCSRALAKTLAGDKTAVSYAAMPVVVKTPFHPVAVCPPKPDVKGDWALELTDEGVVGKFLDEDDVLCGYILTGKTLKLRAELQKQMPAWL